MVRRAARRSPVIAGIALVAVMWCAAAAQGAVRTGAQASWPSGALDVNTQRYNPSIERMVVRYDDTAATVTTTITLDNAIAFDQYFSFSYALAKPQAGRSCANSSHLTPLAYFDGYVSGGYRRASVWFDASSGYTGSFDGTVAVRAPRDPVFTVSGGQALTRQDLRCAMSVSASGHAQSYEADNFCLGECPRETGSTAPPPVLLPQAPTGLRASVAGQTVTLSWDSSRDPLFSYFAVRRDTQPNPNLNPVQWTRLPSNFTSAVATDSPRPGTYWYYVTQINTRGQVSARSATVRVDVPPPSPPPPPPRPTTVTQVTNPVVKAPPSSAGQRSVTAAQALREVRSALRLVYKSAFSHATSFKSACRRVSASKRVCTVSWRHKRYRYRGRVVVRLSASGYATAVDANRSRVR